ncbi:MAG: sulfite exporter TauE/SafE family protein [Pseudomonadota bacterium]
MDVAVLLAALGAGFFGQAHCAAMCGPLVSLFERSDTAATLTAARRRGGYQLGRLTAYVALGIGAGLIGSALTAAVVPGGVTFALRLVAAVAVLTIGFALLGFAAPVNAATRLGQRLWRALTPLTRHVLPMSTLPRAVGAGALWGLLPCGLVYAAVALALVAGSAAGGALAMLAFWIGTLPVTLAIGAGAGVTPTNPAARQLVGSALVVVAAFSVGMLLTMAAEAATTPDWRAAFMALCQR